MGYPKGAFVVKVTEGSAAEAAGIYFGDTITKFDGQTVTGFEGLRDIMSYYKAGDTVDVTLQRNVNGKFEEITVSVTLGKRPAVED
ncbi:MAG: PDZ domain-containing protein, partial [Lachnospiraceae bacterium]|nr:PDZ domain-containing protein [Lachnospiraceae bacterium]